MGIFEVRIIGDRNSSWRNHGHLKKHDENYKPEGPRSSINSKHKKCEKNYIYGVSNNLYRKIFNYKFNVFIRFRANHIVYFFPNELVCVFQGIGPFHLSCWFGEFYETLKEEIMPILHKLL